MIRGKKSWSGLLPMAVFAGLLAHPSSIQATTFSLEYQTNGPSASFSLSLEESEVVFKKEPDYAGKEIVRSALYLTPDKKEYIGFACDLEKKTLYLDLNRNLDLTDDPDGIFHAGRESWARSYEGISIPIEENGRRRDMRVDLQLYNERWGQYTVKSSWGSHVVVLGTQTCWITVVDNGDGVITSKDTLFLQPMGKKGGNEAQVEVQAPTSLILNDGQYALSYELASDGKILAMSIEPGTNKLLEVELTGQGIERLVMQDAESAAVFFGPEPVIRVPAGRYSASVWTRVGEGKESSLWEANRVACHVPDDGQRSSWAVGGPLTNKLTCKMAGSRLTFNQATLGLNGEKYSMESSSRSAHSTPKLRVEKDGQVVHVGKFEYG